MQANNLVIELDEQLAEKNLEGLWNEALWDSDAKIMTKDPQTAENRQTGILENRELTGEGGEVLGPDAPKYQAAFFARARGGGFLARFFDRDLRNEVPHLANRSLRIFFGGRIDHIFDLSTCRIHRFELEGRHFKY